VAALRVAEGGRVTVGSDGVRITRPFGKEVFIAYGDVARAEACTYWLRPSILIALRSGVTLQLAWQNRGLRDRTVERDELVRRLDAEARAPRASPPAAALFARSGPVGDWIRRVRSLPRDASYRGVTPDMLWALVESPAAEPTARAGAAAALAESLDDEGRVRLRVAAEACAEPRLRVALEAAADDDDDVLTEALGRLEE